MKTHSNLAKGDTVEWKGRKAKIEAIRGDYARIQLIGSRHGFTPAQRQVVKLTELDAGKSDGGK